MLVCHGEDHNVIDSAIQFLLDERRKVYVHLLPKTSSSGIAERRPSRYAFSRFSASLAQMRSRSGSGTSRLFNNPSTMMNRSSGGSWSAFSRISTLLIFNEYYNETGSGSQLNTKCI